MVHGELIAAGKVEKLTYKQLRRLEKIDAAKARNEKLLDLAKEAVIAGGQVGRGIMQGNITGPVALFLILSSEPQLLTLAYNNLAALAGIIGSAIKSGVVPDVNAILNSNQANPSPPPPPPQTPGGTFGLHQTGATIFQVGAGDQYYDTAASRDAAVNSINSDLWFRFVGKHVTQTWELVNGQRINVVDVPLPPAWIFPVA